jgi:hypothetical protein
LLLSNRLKIIHHNIRWVTKRAIFIETFMHVLLRIDINAVSMTHSILPHSNLALILAFTCCIHYSSKTLKIIIQKLSFHYHTTTLLINPNPSTNSLYHILIVVLSILYYNILVLIIWYDVGGQRHYVVVEISINFNQTIYFHLCIL